MSTKTSFKRIAAVAAVALALGGFSAVSANAATSALTAVAVAGNPALGSVGSLVTLQFTETATAGAAADTAAFTTSLGVSADGGRTSGTNTALATSLLGTVTNGTVAIASNVATYTATAAGTISATVAITFTPDVPGTYTVSVTPASGSVATAIVTVAKTSPQFLNKNNTPAAVGSVSASTGSALTAIAGGFATAQILVNSIASDLYITYSGVGSLTAASATVAASLSNSSGAALNGGISSALKFAAGTDGTAATDVITLSALSNVAGVGTITIQPVNATTGIPGTAVSGTITWGAAPVVSTQYSTAYIGVGATNASANATALSFSKSATGVVANVAVNLMSSATASIAGQGLTATIAGAGTLSLTNTTTASTTAGGRALSFAAASGNASTFTVGVFADGTTGVGTITISSGTTTIATKTVTFVGSPAKATVTQNLYIAKAGTQLGATPDATDALNLGLTVATTAAFTAEVVDALGNDAAAGSVVKVVSGNTTVIAGGSCVEMSDAPGNFQCSVTGASGAVSGQSTTVTFEVYNSTTAAYDILAAPLTFNIGKAAYTVALSTDATSYEALSPVQLIATVKDSAGNAAADGDVSLFGATLTASTQLGGATLPGTTAVTVKNGVHTFKGLYAPASAKEFVVSGVEGLSGLLGAITTGTVIAVGDTAAATAVAAAQDAAQEATDAANAAYDAANNAMDSADAATAAAQDASDNASAALAAVTSLSATVAKLVSSVTAIATALAAIKKKLGVK